MKDGTNKTNRRGVALLVVLFVVMTVTILSLGFLSQSDVELACGENMILRTKMDYLAESGLEHAKGLIISPQDVDTGYWMGEARQQLAAGSEEYYDVNVVKLGGCNYQISCEAYREKGGEKIGRSRLRGELRLDPCIALWLRGTWKSELQATVNGDVYCNGRINGAGCVNGDAFAADTITELYVEGRKNEAVTQPPITWPGLDINDFSSNYYVGSTSYTVQSISPGTYINCTFGSASSEPPEVFYCNGNLELAGSVTINGMLVVDHNMTISDANGTTANVITAGKNFPALLVGNEMTMNNGGKLEVRGLAQIRERIYINAGAENVNINVVGGLFIDIGNIDGLNSSSLSNSVTITGSPSTASIEIWPTPGNCVRWTPAGGAFFRSIKRI
ncbi:MAG: hypothetical protein ACYSSO_04210 [Planctomycetota bacterium]|jgi:hypothetical protein